MTAEGRGPLTKPLRSARLTFMQATLFLEGLAALFATVTVAGLVRAGEIEASNQTVWAGGLATAACLVLATGFMDRPWGPVLGSLLQVPLIAGGAISWAVAFIGVMFAAVWIAALVLGRKIDRERAERDAAFEKRRRES